jgi:hypothetical protein
MALIISEIGAVGGKPLWERKICGTISISIVSLSCTLCMDYGI